MKNSKLMLNLSFSNPKFDGYASISYFKVELNVKLMHTFPIVKIQSVCHKDGDKLDLRFDTN